MVTLLKAVISVYKVKLFYRKSNVSTIPIQYTIFVILNVFTYAFKSELLCSIKRNYDYGQWVGGCEFLGFCSGVIEVLDISTLQCKATGFLPKRRTPINQ